LLTKCECAVQLAHTEHHLVQLCVRDIQMFNLYTLNQQRFQYMLFPLHLVMSVIRTLVVIGTDCIGSYKST